MAKETKNLSAVALDRLDGLKGGEARPERLFPAASKRIASRAAAMMGTAYRLR